MNIVITTLSSLLNTNSSFNVKPVNFIKLIKNILEVNVYEIDVAIAAPAIPNLGINNILNITLTKSPIKLLNAFNSGFPLDAISFANILPKLKEKTPINNIFNGIMLP